MKRFLLKVLLFLTPIIVYSVLATIFLPPLLTRVNGPNTKQQIDYSFENAVNEDYGLLILGNSRVYRGLNPDMFSIKSYNFSHDNDSYNQMYFKLKFLLEQKKDIDYLILGLDYFQFSFLSNTRNYVYADYFAEEYNRDFNDKTWKLKLEYHLGNANPKKLLSLRPKPYIPILKKNGQYLRSGEATEDDSIQRDITRLEIQELYFQEIIDLCRDNNIKVFIVMLPIRENELISYSQDELDEFNSFINGYVDNNSTYYLNFSLIDDFNTEDYTDITHLNEEAADRFSSILNDSLMEILEQ
jgi:hypothetical protein